MSFNYVWGGCELGDGTSRVRKKWVWWRLRWRCIVINPYNSKHSPGDICFNANLHASRPILKTTLTTKSYI